MAFGRKQQEIEGLRAEIAELLEDNLRMTKLQDAAGRITYAALQELERAEELGIIGQEAEAMATVAVVEAEKPRIVSETSARLIEEKYDEFAADYRVKEGPGVVAGLRKLFESDGTNDRLREKAERDTRAALQTELLTELEEKAKEELSTPENEARLREEARQELLASPEAAEMRAKIRRAKEIKWQEEAHQEVIAEIEEEEDKRGSEFKETYKKRLRESWDMKERRTRVREQKESEWSKKTLDEVTKEIGDEELKALLSTKAEKAKEKLQKELRAQELLQDFEGLGIDMASIDPNTRVVIYLGEVTKKSKKESYYDDFSRLRERTVVTSQVNCRRKLSLLSLGEGRYIVDEDTLQDSKSVYERENTIPHGRVISIGRKLEENGKERLEMRLAADAPLYFDDDTTNPEFINAILPVANVTVAGVSARDIETVEML